MKAKTFKVWMTITTIIMGAASPFWVMSKHPLGLVLTIAIGTIIILIMGKTVKEVISDERSEKIGQKAATISYSVYSISVALLGAVLVCIDKDPAGGALTTIGMTLALSVAFLFIIFITARTVIQNRKVL